MDFSKKTKKKTKTNTSTIEALVQLSLKSRAAVILDHAYSLSILATWHPLSPQKRKVI
jgi:hypothetical protein